MPFIATASGSVLDGSHAVFRLGARHACGAVIPSFGGALQRGFAMLATDLDDAERDGRHTLVGVPVFAEACRRADLPLLAWLFSRPWLRWLPDPAYALFARHRAGVSALPGPHLLRLAQWTCTR